MKRVSIAGILALGLIASPAASAWDQVYDFEEFPLGTVKGHDADAPITDLWKVSRDEGFEAGRSFGFMHLTIIDEARDCQRIFSPHSGGTGFGPPQTFSGLNFDRPITDQGTAYFQIMTVDLGFDLNIGVTDRAFVAVDPAPETNPWGYRAEPLVPGEEPSAHGWGDLKTAMRNDGGMIGIRDGGQFRHGAFAWVPGAWYEVWQTLDVNDEQYTVWLRSPDAGIPERVPLVVEIDGAYYDHYDFRTPVEDLRALLVFAGGPDPSVESSYFLNAIAVDLNAHNLTSPDVELPAIPREYRLWYGFSALEGDLGELMWADASFFLGSEVFFGRVPYVWSRDLRKWIYLPDLWVAPEVEPDTGEVTTPGKPRDSDFNLAVRAGQWTYIRENPFTPDEWTASPEIMTWVWGTESGWVYIVNSRG